MERVNGGATDLVRRWAGLLAAASVALSLAAAPAASGATSLERVPNDSTSFDQPIHVAQPPTDSNRLFIVERPGKIRVIRDGALLASPFLDISDVVADPADEQGLFSVAFPPNYGTGAGATTRRFYVFFTNNAGDLRIKEYKRSRSTGDVAVGHDSYNRTVLAIPHRDATSHNGGQLQFGPKGHLFAATGDGTNGNNSQRKTSLLGKLLRVDPLPSAGKSHTNPPGNPYAGPAPGAGEIFSRGLRNPFRFSFDGQTLAIGDVGAGTFEEHDILSRSAAKGANFGWPNYEGPHLREEMTELADHTGPTFWYCHSALQDPQCPPSPTGNVTTGGYIVRDESLGLTGRYLYADFDAGEIRTLDPADTYPFPTDTSTGVSVPFLSSFGRDNQNRLYAASLDGPVYRIVNSD